MLATPSPTYWGEIAALGVAFCWVGTSLAFAQAGKRIGSMSVNLIRFVFAIPLLAILAFAVRGQWLPLDAGADQWFWLSVSGLIGFVFGDMCLFRAFILIGPRLSSLIMAVTPLLTALIGYFVLGESFGGWAAVGMACTILGVAWAISDKDSARAGDAAIDKKDYWLGILLALMGALGQATGLIISKYGMVMQTKVSELVGRLAPLAESPSQLAAARPLQYDPFAATQIRVLVAFIGFTVLFSFAGLWPKAKLALRDTRSLTYLAIGSVFGPVVGVSLSLLSVQYANAGVAASIMSITPILLIPIAVVFLKERVGLGGIMGTLLAVAGVAILFLH